MGRLVNIVSAIILVMALMPSDAFPAQVVGVNVPDTVQTADGATLKLNGAGVRTKLFFDIYVGALYLPGPATDAESVVKMAGHKQVHLHFLYKDVEKKKITDGWREGFEANLSEDELKALAERIERFCSLFEDTKSGETYTFEYLPGMGTRVLHNGEFKANMEGDDFMRALMLIWLGDKPAHKGLKKAMLGGK